MAPTLAELQLQLDTFRAYYNHHRSHQALGSRTPLTAFNARIKARPTGPDPEVHYRVRHDRVDKSGRITLRPSADSPTLASGEPTSASQSGS